MQYFSCAALFAAVLLVVFPVALGAFARFLGGLRNAAALSIVVALVLTAVAVTCSGCSQLQTAAGNAEQVIEAGLPPGTYQLSIYSPVAGGSITYTKDASASAAAGHTVLTAPSAPAGAPIAIHSTTKTTSSGGSSSTAAVSSKSGGGGP